jgi:hypothetical protein
MSMPLCRQGGSSAPRARISASVSSVFVAAKKQAVLLQRRPHVLKTIGEHERTENFHPCLATSSLAHMLESSAVQLSGPHKHQADRQTLEAHASHSRIFNLSLFFEF